MPPTILLTTPRLVLRTVTPEDVPLVAASMNLDEPPISLVEAQEEIIWMMHNHEQNGSGKIVHLCLAIFLKESEEIIGWCGLDHRKPEYPHPVLFYLLKKAYWGQGLATEAVRALFDHAFCEYHLERIDSATDFDNLASKRVMEKLGMTCLGLDSEGGHLFTLSREEYQRLGRVGK